MKKQLIVLILLVVCCSIAAQYAELLDENIDIPQGGVGFIEVWIGIPAGHYATHQEEFFGIDIIEKDGIRAGNTIYPDIAIETEYGYSIYKDEVYLRKEIIVDKNAKIGLHKVEVYVMYQMCLESGVCLAPEEEEFVINVYVLSSKGIKEGKNNTSDNTYNNKNKYSSKMIDLNHLLLYLLLAFIGGIILNLTPCVLPVLTMRTMSLVKQSQDSPRTVFLNSLMYTIGILISFLILACVIISIKLAGESVGWGFQNQNPVFVIILFSILYLFSLSLFDIFLLQAPGTNMATAASSRKGYLGSFFMGIFAVLLGTPCMAPFLGAAIGFALLQPPLIILTIFILVGIGFAFPFLLVGIFPKAIKILPKPGEWMETFKQVLGFILLGFAIDQLNTLYKLTSGSFLINVLFYTLVLTFAAWLYGKFVTPIQSKLTQWMTTLIGIGIIVFGALFFLKGISIPYENTDSYQDNYWEKFSSENVEKNITAGKPVFIDFTAAWCKNCKTNEKLVLNTIEIRDAFAKKEVVMLKGDFTKKDNEILSWLTKYNRAGVPLYLLFLPGVEEPIVFPELLTKQIILEALKRIEN